MDHTRIKQTTVLFLCTGNSCRSQMAEGWARQILSDKVEPYSAGIEAHGMNPNAVKVMQEYDWPGNIRELENSIEHAFVIARGQVIRLKDLPETIHPKDGAFQIPSGLTLKEIEKQAIYHALVRNNWKKMATARELGIDKNTLRRKINRLGIKGV